MFAILSSQLREGTKVHAIASSRAGAGWWELHAVYNLIYLYANLSAMNFVVGILSQLKADG